MKTPAPSSLRNHASVLLVALIVSAILGVTLASFLVMTQAQNASVRRAQCWNASIALSEAGIEDALAHLNSDNGMSGIYGANGWALQADGSYAVTRYVDDAYYTASITFPNGSYPVVVSQGYVPFNLVAANLSSPAYAAVGTDPGSGKFMSRGIRVTTRLDGLLTVAMAAKENIDLKGNNVSSDSFDSGDPNYSSNGLYTVTKALDHGDVATDSTLTNSLNVGNANLRGTIRTGPKGLPAIGSNGSVGDMAWVNGGNMGIQPGHFVDDMNVVFPSVKLPAVSFTVISTPNPRMIDGVLYQYVLGDGNYQLDDLHQTIYVNGNAVLYVPPAGRVNLSGQDKIYIERGLLTNSTSLKLFVACPTASLGGLGVVNATGIARNFGYFGLPTNTDFKLAANAAFVGMIYCPDATFTLGGGGADNYDFVGASVSRTVKMNGNFYFHYDENLRKVGPARGFVATNWREI